MNLGDKVKCKQISIQQIGLPDSKTQTIYSSHLKADSIELNNADLSNTLTNLAGGSLTADWSQISNKPHENSFIDWTQDQGDTNINVNNYINTTYTLASNGQAGLTNFNFNETRKNKLANIEENAQVNIKANWNETNSNSDAFIQNKPTIPSINGTSDVPGLDTALSSKMPKSGGTFTGEIVLDQASTDSHAFLSITKDGSGTFMDVDTNGQFTFHKNLILRDPSEIQGYMYYNQLYVMTWSGDKDGLHVLQNGVLSFPSINDVEAAINLNSAKVGITQSEQDAIVANSAKVSYPGPPSWSQVTNKPNLQLALDTPVVNSPSGTGNLTLTNNTLLTYTPPDLSSFVQNTGNETIGGTKTFSDDIDASSNVNVGDLLKFDTGSGWGDLINMRGGAGSFGYQTMISHNYHSTTFRPKLEFKFGYVNHPTAGTSVVTGGYVTRNGFANGTSDDRLKHDEITIENGLEIIRNLNPQYYRKTFDFQDSEEEYVYEAGFIAQEILQTELKFAVSDGDYVNEAGETIEEPYRLDYNSVFTYSVAAVKEMDQIIQSQAKQIEILENKVNKLTKLFDSFKE